MESQFVAVLVAAVSVLVAGPSSAAFQYCTLGSDGGFACGVQAADVPVVADAASDLESGSLELGCGDGIWSDTNNDGVADCQDLARGAAHKKGLERIVSDTYVRQGRRKLPASRPQA